MTAMNPDPRHTMILHEAHGTRLTPALTRDEARWEREQRAALFPPGTRVKLLALAQTIGGYDDTPNLPPGSTGTVLREPDACGSLPIEWDHGSRLAATANDVIVKIAPDKED